jgi:phage terminase small subunit
MLMVCSRFSKSYGQSRKATQKVRAQGIVITQSEMVDMARSFMRRFEDLSSLILEMGTAFVCKSTTCQSIAPGISH